MANLAKIKILAKKQGIQLKELAERLGMTPQALTKIMDKGSTTIDTLEAISSELGVSASTFFDNSEYSNTPSSADGEILLNLSRTVASQQDTIRDLCNQLKGAASADAYIAAAR